MSEQPDETPASRIPTAVGEQLAAGPRPDGPWPPRYQRPRVVVRADLMPAAWMAAFVAVLGVGIGWIWSRIAPPERVGISGDGQVLPLVDESYHRFDDLAIFLLLGLAAGLIIGAALWLWRERRGPTMLLAAVAAAVLAAWLATKTGTAFAAGRYPAPTTSAVGTLFAVAPRLESAWVLLAQPLGVALAYGALAAWNGLPDLGRHVGAAEASPRTGGP